MPDTRLIYELISWFGFLLSAGFGNPIPEELMLISGGIRTAQMGDDFGLFRWLMLPVCLIGGVGADLVLYGIGRVFGTHLLETRIMKRLAPPEKRARIHANFHRYGILIFVIGRLVPGIRTTLFLTAGTMRLGVLRFVLADGIGALVGGGLFFLLGFGLGSQFMELIKQWENQIRPYEAIIILSLLVLVAAYLMYNFLRHPISTGDPTEVPLIGPQIAAHIPPQQVVPEERVESPALGSEVNLGK